jgi:glycerophosphoryl diester phosphodiesterase
MSAMSTRLLVLVLMTMVLGVTLAACGTAPEPPAPAADSLPPRPWNIAHRGAAAYAPENTIPAYMLGADQGAHFVEIDLQRTKDGHLISLHDITLERTTDIARVFPDRARPAPDDAEQKPRWWLDDFTLDELRQLDAGTWFDPRFAGTRIPTFDEIIRAVRGRTGIFIELKSPERYPGIEAEMMAVLESHGLHQPGADPKTPIVIQSFSVPSIETLAAMRTPLPLHVLFGARDADTWLSEEGLQRLRTFATGISPEKPTLDTHAAGWARATVLGLPITPWTFRASTVKGYPTVTAEMQHYIAAGAAGVITDNPDLAPSGADRPAPTRVP